MLHNGETFLQLCIPIARNAKPFPQMFSYNCRIEYIPLNMPLGSCKDSYNLGRETYAVI